MTEQEFIKSIWPALTDSMKANAGFPEFLSSKETDNYTVVSCENFTVFRLHLRGRKYYIAVPELFADMIPADYPRDKNKDGYIRLLVDAEHPAEMYADFLARLAGETLNRYPKDFDCCSRYMECSNAKKCVHPNKKFSLQCGYRKILKSGRIFYGKNRNVD